MGVRTNRGRLVQRVGPHRRKPAGALITNRHQGYVHEHKSTPSLWKPWSSTCQFVYLLVAFKQHTITVCRISFGLYASVHA
eukprot:scaffold231458_cov31-Tisochrysis_lutea.AAC.1